MFKRDTELNGWLDSLEEWQGTCFVGKGPANILSRVSFFNLKKVNKIWTSTFSLC